MDALLTLSSKGQLVIPARLRQLLGLQPGDRLALSLEADGLRWIPGAAPELGADGSGIFRRSMSLPVALDTNVLVAWLDRINPRQVWLPSVVVFELRYGAAIHPDASRRQKLELALHRLITEMIQERIAPLDARAANQAALFAAQRKMQGRSVDLRDTLIAGIALAHEAQLATRNVRHFSDTTISLINPFATDPQYG